MMMGQVPVAWLRYERKRGDHDNDLTGDDNDESWKMAGRKKISITSRKLVFITSGPNEGVGRLEADRTHGEKFFFEMSVIILKTKFLRQYPHFFSVPISKRGKMEAKMFTQQAFTIPLAGNDSVLGLFGFLIHLVGQFLVGDRSASGYGIPHREGQSSPSGTRWW